MNNRAIDGESAGERASEREGGKVRNLLMPDREKLGNPASFPSTVNLLQKGGWPSTLKSSIFVYKAICLLSHWNLLDH